MGPGSRRTDGDSEALFRHPFRWNREASRTLKTGLRAFACNGRTAMAEKQATLLVAEHGSELTAALGPCLGEKGCKVKSVNNLKDMLITLQNEAIRVLVLDAGLAREMGYDSIPIIKTLGRNLPIIIATEANNPELESAIRQKGIFYYHLKSFGMDELLLAITSAMARPFS